MVRLSNFIIETKTNVEYSPESQKTTFTTVRGEIKSIDLSAVFFLQDVQTASAHAGTAVNLFAANELQVEAAGPAGKRITIDSSHLMGDLMGLAGGTMTVSDGTSNRVIHFVFTSTQDNHFSVSSGSGPFSLGTDSGEQHIIASIMGSIGGSINVTATNVNDSSDDVVVDISHNSGGPVSVTFQQNTGSNAGSDFLAVSDIAGAPSQDRLETTVNFSHEQPVREINYLLIAGTNRGD